MNRVRTLRAGALKGHMGNVNFIRRTVTIKPPLNSETRRGQHISRLISAVEAYKTPVKSSESEGELLRLPQPDLPRENAFRDLILAKG